MLYKHLIYLVPEYFYHPKGKLIRKNTHCQGGPSLFQAVQFLFIFLFFLLRRVKTRGKKVTEDNSAMVSKCEACTAQSSFFQNIPLDNNYINARKEKHKVKEKEYEHRNACPHAFLIIGNTINNLNDSKLKYIMIYFI